ncbi:uncharacterized protein LOC130290486 isoform X2 [Hyla sarda]|uniref:uncharacterized protein LOC130290486 isoform X2 n=1 Tax=Hyla sarda TaxID=327740 RepID=UPI0024C33C79|nr:uncharacterized protein LOC130290486 isoform X2 [Hyla sarda]
MVTEEPTSGGPAMDGLLPRLLSPLVDEGQECVALLMDRLQSQCEDLVDAMVKDQRCDRYLDTLCRFLHTPNVRLCSNVAYILGTVAEDPGVAVMLVNLAERATDWDLLGRLGAMLLWDDAESVMNAAGALGTLAENGQGRRWLLSSPDSDFIIENITKLLDSPSDWTASNCALVLARISMCQEGCERLLEHPKSDMILRKIIASLQVDEAGCGLNAAFTLGRLCDTDAGRRRVLALEEADNMICALEAMMSGGDAGGSRNACFALTCLATSQAGHQHLLKSHHFPQVLDTLCHLLQSTEHDSCWFAAITVKGISKFPSGVLRLWQHPTLEAILKKIAASHTAGDELRQEVEHTLRNLQRLPQPSPPTAKILGSGSVVVSWKEHRAHSGLMVTYRLYDGDHLLYHGPSFSYVLPYCKPGHHHLKVVMETEGDRSPASAITMVTVEEPAPSCPTELQVVGRTATKVRLSWSPPADCSTSVKYAVYREDALVDTTSDLTCIVGGLSPSTSYTFSVCSCNSRGHSPRVSVVARTMDGGDHAPDRLTVCVIGRSELFITWEVPKDPIGRFFNYELSMNGKSVYLGTERSYTARRLTPSTEYVCTVCAITSKGRFESRPVTKRTARDEYSNLNKNQTGGGRHTETSPATEATDQSEKPHRTEPPRRSSLTKSQSVRLVMSRQASKCKRDNKVHCARTRRESVISWMAESNNSPGTSQSSPTKSSSPSDVTSGHMSKTLSQKESKKCPEQTENSGEKKPELRNPAELSPKPSKQTPLKTPDSPSSLPSCVSPDTKKPHGALGFRLMPIASLCSLEPEYLLHSRAKTETELIRPTGQDGPLQPILLQECSGGSDKDRCPAHKKALQPVRDPIVRYRHRSLKINAWDFTDAVTSGEKILGKFSASCPLTPTEDVLSHVSTATKSFARRDGLLSWGAGNQDGRRHSWSHLRTEVSSLQGLKSTEAKSVESLRGRRRRGSLTGSLQKDVHVLIGESGVTFRLPPSAPLRGSGPTTHCRTRT